MDHVAAKSSLQQILFPRAPRRCRAFQGQRSKNPAERRMLVKGIVVFYLAIKCRKMAFHLRRNGTYIHATRQQLPKQCPFLCAQTDIDPSCDPLVTKGQPLKNP